MKIETVARREVEVIRTGSGNVLIKVPRDEHDYDRLIVNPSNAGKLIAAIKEATA